MGSIQDEGNLLRRGERRDEIATPESEIHEHEMPDSHSVLGKSPYHNFFWLIAISTNMVFPKTKNL